MKIIKKINKNTILITLFSIGLALKSSPIFAEVVPEKKVDTAIIDGDIDIAGLLRIVVVILTTGVGIAATVAFVMAGVIYSTAGGSAQQVQKAKEMILNTVLGLSAYALMFAFVNWLIPGGVIK